MPRIYAHRGARLELPENTVPAFARALEVGADALELDCHMTRDGVVVVSHDESGRRMANVDRAIRDAGLSEVQSWDVGVGFRDAAGEQPFRGRGFRVPTLAEVLAEFPGVRLNIDAKQEQPDMVPELLRVLRAARAEDHVHLASFSAVNLHRIRGAGYRGGTSLGPGEVVRLKVLPRALLRLPGLRVGGGEGTRAQIPRRQGPVTLDGARFVSKCHALGIAVDYWTINDPDEARVLVGRGADGIITDDARGMVTALRSTPAR